jgi:hypothetical protein
MRQPLLLVPNELSCDSSAREPDGELRSKLKDGVVPARVNGRDIKRGEFGMLCLNQRANQNFIDLDFRWWCTTIHVEILKEILRWRTRFETRSPETSWPPNFGRLNSRRGGR